MVTTVERLAQQIESLRSELHAYTRTPQLIHSSIDNGSVALATDGTVTGTVGSQADGGSGIVVITAPKPPRPDAPVVATAIGGISVTWDGSFLDTGGYSPPSGAFIAPSTFAGVDVQVSLDPSFPSVGLGNVVATIPTAAGGTVLVKWAPTGTNVYVRLVSRTIAGTYSDPGPTTGPVASGKVQLGDLGFDIGTYAGGTTIFYGSATPASPVTGDLWLYDTGAHTAGGAPIYITRRWLGSAWTDLQDQGISTALANALAAQSAADSKAKVFAQDASPSYSGAANTAVWYETDNGNKRYVWNGTSWAASLLGNGSIQPNTLIASNVIATGTITAALLETTMVLTTTLQAGLSNASHATVQSDGFHLFGNVPGEGVQEIGRMATGTNNYFAFTDSTGTVVANWDSTGYISASGANFLNDIIVQGRALSDSLTAASGSGNGEGTQSGAQNWFGYNYGAGVGGVTTEYGLIEVPVWVDTARMYLIIPDLAWNLTDVRAQLDVRVRDGGTGQPSISSTPLIYYRQFGSETVGYDITASGPGLWQPTGTAGVHQHRLLLSVAAGGTGAVNINGGVGGLQPPSLFVIDLGPSKSTANTLVNRGGGTLGGVTTPPPGGSSSQQYDTGWMAPTSWATFQGGGTSRVDTGGDIVQGWDPSGYNGDGYGYAGFSLPSITNVVDRIDLLLAWDWAYYNSGGTAIINVLHSGTMTPASSFIANKMKSNWNVGLSGKTGSGTVTLPSDWWPLFKSSASPRASFIGFGTSGGSNEAYYMKFPSGSLRLRIWYTQ